MTATIGVYSPCCPLISNFTSAPRGRTQSNAVLAKAQALSPPQQISCKLSCAVLALWRLLYNSKSFFISKSQYDIPSLQLYIKKLLFSTWTKTLQSENHELPVVSQPNYNHRTAVKIVTIVQKSFFDIISYNRTNKRQTLHLMCTILWVLNSNIQCCLFCFLTSLQIPVKFGIAAYGIFPVNNNWCFRNSVMWQTAQQTICDKTLNKLHTLYLSSLYPTCIVKSAVGFVIDWALTEYTYVHATYFWFNVFILKD